MFEIIKGQLLLKQSKKLGIEAATTVGVGETFDDTDDLIVTYVMAGYYFAIVYRHLQKREKDIEKINWVVGNAIIEFYKIIPGDKTLQNRLINVYQNAKANLSLDNEQDENHEMYEELITDYLHELYGKYITEDIMKRSVASRMLVPVYNSAVQVAGQIKL